MEANHMSANPNFHKDKHYKNNCQTCVVAFEARLRGYNVETNPNTRHSMSWRVSAQTNLPWIDPETGEHPEYIFDETANTPETFMDFMERTVHQGERYTIGFSRKLREPHIISLDRTDSGKLRLYDPQNGKIYTGIKLLLYLKTIKYVHRDGDDFNQRYDSPRLLRVDNALFDMSIVEKLLKGKE